MKFGHISRSSGSAKTILQDTVKAKRRDKQKKRWEDNIKEWTRIDFVSSTRAASKQATVKGKRRRGRQKKKWEDNM